MASTAPAFHVQANPFPATTDIQFRLSPSTWDDYSLQTLFDLYLVAGSATAEMHLGPVKILARRYGEDGEDGEDDEDDEDDRINRTVERLGHGFYVLDPAEFCSLGQSADYYARLRWVGENIQPGLADVILSALNDICMSSAPAWWAEKRGFNDSLLRFRDAVIAKRQAAALLKGENIETHNVNSIPISKVHTTHRINPQTLDFEFDGNARIPRRACVIVGRNGTGKTTLLCDLALSLSEESSHGKFDYAPSFSRVIFVSFNAFDGQHWAAHPRWQRSSLRFVGYRGGSQEMAEWMNSLDATNIRPWGERLLERFPSPESLRSQVPSYVDDGMLKLDELRKDREWVVFCKQAFEASEIGDRLIDAPAEAVRLMSAGQRVLTSLYANLYYHLDKQSLVLLDEPENHLHPSLVARFIRQLCLLLERKQGFAIIATHSPIIAQETPSSNVFIAERLCESTTLSRPPFETYGESIDNLNEYLFGTDSKSSAWKATLADLVRSGLSPQEIQAELGGRELPAFARAYIQLTTIREQRGS